MLIKILLNQIMQPKITMCDWKPQNNFPFVERLKLVMFFEHSQNVNLDCSDLKSTQRFKYCRVQ